MYKHKSESIYGDPADCWIKYDVSASNKLESAYQANREGQCSPSSGYMVNFVTMKQIKESTGYQRDVQRLAEASNVSALPPPTTSTSSVRALPPPSSSGISWTPLTGTAPDGLPGFKPANTKSTTRGLNANPFSASYIFGKPLPPSNNAGQLGYYHITTKEA